MAQEFVDEYTTRLAKLKKIRQAGLEPYPDHFDKTQPVAEILSLKTGQPVATAGRIVTIREMGKICFCHIVDPTGRIQLVFKSDDLGQEKFKQFIELFDAGDFLGVNGSTFTTKKGEHSILVKRYTLLSKALRPLPEKWHGLKDQEAKYRQRYLDLIANPETYQRFLFRSELIKTLRQFYWDHGFIEIETPVLANTASGALAKPFKTHHNTLDLDVYLRIAIETYQKEAIIGGFEKVFEIGRVFRNEGMDPSHLQEFSMAEHYAAYWNFADNMKFTETMFSYLLKKLFGRLKIDIKDRGGKITKIDFKPPWPQLDFQQLIKKDCGLDLSQLDSAQALLAEIKKKKIKIEDKNLAKLGYGNLVDVLYKTVSRSKIIQPTFLTGHPIEVSPLARRNDTNSRIVDRFQLVVNSWELVNAYSELVDPLDQQQRFEQQAKAKAAGDLDAHGKDSEFIRALEHGAPPTSGWGLGIDRLVALLTKQDNLRDVVLFPLLRPER